MAQVSSDVEHGNDAVVTSQSLTAETTGTLTCPPELQLPTLPFDLLPEILYRLPVKLLVQLRCLCKFFNSLISDPNFAKKQLQFSTMRHHLMVKCINISGDGEIVLYDYPIPSLFSTSTVVTQTQHYPSNTLTDGLNYMSISCSCDGIFCCTLNEDSCFLWNPSIRTFKLLPRMENTDERTPLYISFGYDHFIDNYKVIVVYSSKYSYEVIVYTLGTDYWRRIEDFPYNYSIRDSGVFVSSTVNWLVIVIGDLNRHFIVSLNLEKESYQELFLPNLENGNYWWSLAVLRDCLCGFASSDMFLDVWIMKEYGNQESWTKLYTIPKMQDRGLIACSALYISEDDQLLVQCVEIENNEEKLVVYNSKTGTLNIPEFQNNYYQLSAKVYFESLISP